MAAKAAQDNEVQIHPVAGEEYVNIESLKDIHVTAAHDETIDITNDRKITVDGKHTETIKGDTTIKITEGKLDHDVEKGTAKFHVKGAVTEIFDDTQTTDVEKAICITSKTASIYIHGATSIQLHVGDSQLWMDSGGSILLKGKHIQIIGSEKVEINGGQVISKADTAHEISGSLVKSEGSVTNTVKGGMVMLNP